LLVSISVLAFGGLPFLIAIYQSKKFVRDTQRFFDVFEEVEQGVGGVELTKNEIRAFANLANISEETTKRLTENAPATHGDSSEAMEEEP